MQLTEFINYLVCPTTGDSLQIKNIDSDDKNFIPVLRTGGRAIPIGLTERVLTNPDGSLAYPVIDEFPVLLAPELLVKESSINNYDVVDLQDKKYAEAYAEMEVYNKVNEDLVNTSLTSEDDFIFSLMGALKPDSDYLALKKFFPKPEEKWIDAKHDSLGQLEAYTYLAPVKDKVFLQLGGSGAHAVKALLAGADIGLLLTPMIEEARVAMKLADKFGVADKLGCIIAVGEELPFAQGVIDLVYSGGCFHHMRLDYASKELHRVLKSGGRFSGVDPWKTVLHTIGTNIIGKREKSVFCKPITPERLAPMIEQFSDITVNHHGPVLRYMFLALEKVNLDFPIKTMFKISKIDDSLGKAVGLRKYGGSIMIAGTK